MNDKKITIKSVIFDFDGVIADTGRDIVASVQATQRKYNIPELDYKTIMSYVGNGAKYLIDCAMKELSKEDCTRTYIDLLRKTIHRMIIIYGNRFVRARPNMRFLNYYNKMPIYTLY